MLREKDEGIIVAWKKQQKTRRENHGGRSRWWVHSRVAYLSTPSSPDLCRPIRYHRGTRIDRDIFDAIQSADVLENRSVKANHTLC